jgi:hypothetical protein
LKKPRNGEVPGLDADKNAERLAIFALCGRQIFFIWKKDADWING